MPDNSVRHCGLTCEPLGEDITLTEALQRAATKLTGALALLYTPQRCLLARLDEEVLRDHDNQPIGEGAFEVRVFNAAYELRWLQNRMYGVTRHGRAVLIEEHPPGDQADTFETLERTYIVWGRGDGIIKPGWSQVSEARIGPLWLPVENVREQQMVQLLAREYIARDAGSSNAYIADERLIGLQPHRETRHG